MVWRNIDICKCPQEILEVEQIMDEQTGLELTAENVDKVLGEIRPYLIGTGGGGLDMVGIDGPIVKVWRHISWTVGL